VPVLMSLSFAFVLTGKCRVSLVPCMLAHGFNNPAVLMIGVGMLS
jgi:hypothetical protein